MMIALIHVFLLLIFNGVSYSALNKYSAEIGTARSKRSFDCQPGSFICNSTKICVAQMFICDDYRDCEDGSDEWNCTDINKDKYYNSLFKKRPDEDRDKVKLKECLLRFSIPSCQCSWKSLFCENRGLRFIPKNLPTDTKELDLSGNILPAVNYANFTSLIYLQTLIFNNAGVTYLGEMAFYKFTNLKYLYLNGNEIQMIVNRTFVGSSALRFLYLSYNPIQEIEDGAFLGLTSLEELSLRHCSISSITTSTFYPLIKLKSLWLDKNNLVTIPNGSFQRLQHLEILSLTRNLLINVDARTMQGLWSISTLYLTSNSLTYLKENHFGNSSTLLTLDLQDNDIYRIETQAFEMLKNLNSLNLKDNPLRHIQAECFKSLTSLKYIYFSNFYSCSYARHVRVCEPNSDGISSFSHLLDNMLLRISVWLVAGLACLGNACVLIGRALVKETNTVHSFYIKNLSVADFMMCLYLFIIAGHDVAFRGQYIHRDVQWRHSWQCALAGMLSTVSSEASIFIMTLITADRYISIEYPLMHRRRSMMFAVSCVIASWTTAATIAILPFLNLGYFGDEFYGNNGVCLPLQIHDPFSRGWEYSMVIFCGVNTIAFGFIAYAYINMFITISRSKLGLRSSQQQQDRIIAKRFAFIVGTDMLCWVPIIIIKILAVSGVRIHAELYAWVAVFLLPINSALNPVLYTLTTKLFKQQLARIVYTWRASGVPVVSPPESSGISMTSAHYNGRCSGNNSASLITSDLDRSISRSSLLSANSRTSGGRCTWPAPLAYIVYQNHCF